MSFLKACVLIFQFADQPGSAPAMELSGDVIEMSAHKIEFPIHYDPAQKGSIRRLRFYVSEDRGKTWKLLHSCDSSVDVFPFEAAHDGEYWYVMQIENRAGVLDPARAEIPQMKVLFNAMGWPTKKAPVAMVEAAYKQRRNISACTTSAANKCSVKVSCKKETDRIKLEAAANANLSIWSPSGISGANIERTGDTWPDNLKIRLHVQGLESFQAIGGVVTLNAAAANGGQVRLWKDREEDKPLNRQSPYWTEVRIVGSDGKPATTIPLKDGYFEMSLGPAFFEGNPKSIVLNWIDFYRN